MINEFFSQPGAEMFNQYYEKAEKEYEKNGTFFLEESYLKSISKSYDVFSDILDEVVAGAKKIASDREASLYALFVYMSMSNRNDFLKNISLFSFDDRYEFLPFLCLVPYVPDIYSKLISKGIPADVISDTLYEFEGCMHIYSKRFDRLGLNKRYFDFLQKYIDCSILNIGRLRFEISHIEDPIVVIKSRLSGQMEILMTDGKFNKDGLYYEMNTDHENSFVCQFSETDKVIRANTVNKNGRCTSAIKEFSKTEYDVIARKGDTCLSVHIPDHGDFSHESCAKSYSDAKNIFSKYYEELKIRVFTCESWMMAPELSDHLKEDSKILAFSSDFYRYPIHSEGIDVLNFVFYLKGNSYSELPEDTSLQRSLKNLYVSGGKLFEYGGIREY